MIAAEPTDALRETGRRFTASLGGILALGIVVSGVIAALTHGDPFDMASFQMVRTAMRHGVFDVYSDFAHRGIIRWPYPPGFFPWIWAAGRVADFGGPGFEFMLRIPSILADAAIAWLVQDFLRRAGQGPGLRLLAAGLVSVGPSFIVIAGYHGQFDSVAILPGVLAVSLWTWSESRWRWLSVGLLIGLGAALKTVPLLLLLAVLPTARTRREAALVVVAAAVPVLVVFAPFALAGTLPPAHVLSYRGLPGVGDLSLAVQPNLANALLGDGSVSSSALTRLLFNHGIVLLAAALLAVAVVGARGRGTAPQMATLLWLAVYAFGANFFFQYLVWGFPFFLMAGYVRSVLVAQAVLVVPTLIFYLRPWRHVSIAVLYAALMIGLWALAVYAVVLLGRRMWVERLTST